jgi:hypothetical protein
MIRIEHRTLPDGLRAMAVRHDGGLTILVSTGLPACQKRRAVRLVVRAACLKGWTQGGIAVLVAVLGLLLRALRRIAVAHPIVAAGSAVGTVAVTSALVVSLTPGGTPPPRQAVAPARPGISARQTHPRGRRRPTAPTFGVVRTAVSGARSKSPRPGGPSGLTASSQPVPTGSPAPSGSPSPAPSLSVPVPGPSPLPLPTPSPTSSGKCVKLLGVAVCVPLKRAA